MRFKQITKITTNSILASYCETEAITAFKTFTIMKKLC